MTAAIDRESAKRHRLDHLLIDDAEERVERVRLRAKSEEILTAKPKRPYRKRPIAPVAALLLTRSQAAQALACSVSTIIRMEDDGLLTPVKLSRSPTAKTTTPSPKSRHSSPSAVSSDECEQSRQA